MKVYRLLTAKTYEMQMFHMSSLKMGLDQAVLSGFEAGSSGENALTKEEIERLLRHGAYGIMNEEKDGTGEAASKAFAEEDIDSILARRSRTIVYDNTGSESAAKSGTFSKARFTSSTTAGEQAHENIDVEDPDFWKKMLGEPVEEESEIVSGKRTRTVNTYSEADYDKKIRADLELDISHVAEDDEASQNEGNDEDEDDFEEGEESESSDDDDDDLAMFTERMLSGAGGKRPAAGTSAARPIALDEATSGTSAANAIAIGKTPSAAVYHAAINRAAVESIPTGAIVQELYSYGIATNHYSQRSELVDALIAVRANRAARAAGP